MPGSRATDCDSLSAFGISPRLLHSFTGDHTAPSCETTQPTPPGSTITLRTLYSPSFVQEGSLIFLQETLTHPAAGVSWQLESGDGMYFRHLNVLLGKLATLFS